MPRCSATVLADDQTRFSVCVRFEIASARSSRQSSVRLTNQIRCDGYLRAGLVRQVESGVTPCGSWCGLINRRGEGGGLPQAIEIAVTPKPTRIGAEHKAAVPNPYCVTMMIMPMRRCGLTGDERRSDLVCRLQTDHCIQSRPKQFPPPRSVGVSERSPIGSTYPAQKPWCRSSSCEFGRSCRQPQRLVNDDGTRRIGAAGPERKEPARKKVPENFFFAFVVRL